MSVYMTWQVQGGGWCWWNCWHQLWWLKHKFAREVDGKRVVYGLWLRKAMSGAGRERTCRVWRKARRKMVADGYMGSGRGRWRGMLRCTEKRCSMWCRRRVRTKRWSCVFLGKALGTVL